MSDLTNPPSIGTSESPTRATDPASRKERLERIRELCKEPLRGGDTWFLVSRTWYRRWERAMSDTADEKEESVSEADLGPVNNVTLIDPDGELKTNLIEGVDVEFVPVDVWNLFTEWYGESPNPLSRKVVSRGTVTNQCILEIYPPRFRVFRVTDDPFKTETSGAVEFHIQSTQARRIRDFIRDLADTVSPGNTAECRVWNVEASGLSGGEWPSGKIMAANDASTLDESGDTLNDTIIMSGDAFAVEFKKNGKWIVNRPDPAKDDTTQPVFSEGSDFFSTNRFKPVTGPKPQSMGHQTLFKPASAVAKPTKSFPPGTLGLGNLGNTCFMNSAIQCLAHTRELADYFLTNVFSKELNPDNPLGMGGAIAESFGSLLRRIWAPTTTSYSPRDFKQVLARFAPQFSGYQQHDSQELVAFLLDGLHEDLNRVLKKPYVEKPDWEGGGDLELVKLAKDSWDGYMKRNDSVIVDLFQSQYRSTLICPECNKVSITFDPFMYLTLPLPVHKKWRHEIYFIPSDPLKPHTKVPIEITGDASFKEVRQLLGRWLDTNPDHLMVMEVFAQKFYKSLNDSVLVSDMQDGDMIVCYELDGPTHQARNAKRSDSDPLLVPVLLADINPPRFSSFSRSQPQNFGWPLMLALTQDDMRSVERIQERVVEQLSRWTRYSRDLWSWQSTDEPMGEDEVQISFPDAVADAVTEIKENGDIVIQEPVLEVEEGDIVDEKGMILDEPAETLAKGDGGDGIRRLGVKKEIFTMRLQASTKDFGSGYAPTYTKYEEWDDRRQEAAADQLVDDPILLRADDMIVLEFEGNMKDFYFGDEGALFKAWQEFRHPEYEEAERAAKTQTKRGITLQDCLDEFTKEEQLGEDDLWYCPNCKKHQQATKKFDIWGVPDVLVVHLKRFSNSRALRDKIDTFVDFPTEGLDLTDMAQERKVARNLRDQGVDVAALGFDGDLDEPLLYDLFAVDEHLGGLGGGHYRAYSYNPGTEKWHHFDDSFVTEARPEDAINANAYLLFYRRRTSRPLGGKTHTMIEEARVLAQSETPVTTGDSTPDTAPVTTAASTPAQLPTPPNEPAPPALPGRSGEFRSTRWMSTTVSSPSSSPPPLGELDDELPNFEDSQLDEVLGPAYQTMGYGSSKASPSSSVEAELDDSADDEAQERPGWERLVATDDDLDAELGALFGNNDEKKTSLYPSSLWKPVTGSGPLRTMALPNEDASTDGAREGILTPPPESQSQSPSHSSGSGLGLSL